MLDANEATMTVTNRMKTDEAASWELGWSDVCVDIIMHLHLHPHIVTMLQLTNKLWLCDDKIRIL